jgi:hypothetical protein
MLHLSISKSFPSDLAVIRGKITRAGTAAVRATIQRAQGIARREHKGLAGWKNESGNLQRTITGYIAGEDPYKFQGNVTPPKAPFMKGRYMVRSQEYLDKHYVVDTAVSPPVTPIPGHIIGVLHHYMRYGGYLPGTGAGAGREVAVETLERNADTLMEFMAADFRRRID